ncbi:uncharacterized protein CDV56_103195 [Aspergillus thermomutatus]|uniref:Uncharacterized protein n=1 Tax=Aspergillus thermomutatus TaxID=41047 RepID=A0A397G3P4_ASPTH|nr:uncharacterized protein CDV56_103195 [Aspergillus thermomutatus]RHZ44484.1 hypothetical protein CDV56_103195 [Aspergillus thermomutatus]
MVRQLSWKYQDVLEQGESIANYLGAPMVSRIMEERIGRLFSQHQPSVGERGNGGHDMMLTWTEIILEFKNGQLENDDNGMSSIQVRGVTVQLSEADLTMLRSGIPQVLMDPLDAKDRWTEQTAVESSITNISEWNQCAMQANEKFTVIEQNDKLLQALRNRLAMLLNYASTDTQSHSGTLNTPSTGNILGSGPAGVNPLPSVPLPTESEDGASTAQRPRVHTPVHDPAGPVTRRSPQPGSRKWSAEEENRLLDWLEAHCTLTCSKMEHEYEREFGIYRPYPAMQAKAARLQPVKSYNPPRKRTRQSHYTSPNVVIKTPRYTAPLQDTHSTAYCSGLQVEERQTYLPPTLAELPTVGEDHPVPRRDCLPVKKLLG